MLLLDPPPKQCLSLWSKGSALGMQERFFQGNRFKVGSSLPASGEQALGLVQIAEATGATGG
jgi:hypothetical protein